MSTTARRGRLPRLQELPNGFVIRNLTVQRDVDVLRGGFNTDRATELERLRILQQTHEEILAQLVELLRAPGCIISRHPRLSVRNGKGWASRKRRRSFRNMLFLNEHSTTDNLLELLRAGTISGRLLRTFVQRTPKLSETAKSRIERAIEVYRAADPVALLLGVLNTPDEWIRLSVHDSIVEARDNGTLIKLYLDNRVTDDHIGKLEKAGLIGEAFKGRLQQAVEMWLDPTTHDRLFDTGELIRLLDEEEAKVGPN